MSCHYWLPEGGGKKDAQWLLNLPLLRSDVVSDIVARIPYQYASVEVSILQVHAYPYDVHVTP